MDSKVKTIHAFVLIWNALFLWGLLAWLGNWGWIPFGIWLVVELFACYVTVKAPQRGMVLCMGQRTGRVLGEGFFFIWPFVDTVEYFTREMQGEEQPIVVQVLTRFPEEVDVGNRKKQPAMIEITGRLTWKTDTDSPFYLNRFFETSRDLILKEVPAAIANRLGEEAGMRTITDFINYREEVQTIINISLRGNDRNNKETKEVMRKVTFDPGVPGDPNHPPDPNYLPHEKALEELKNIEQRMYHERESGEIALLKTESVPPQIPVICPSANQDGQPDAGGSYKVIRVEPTPPGHKGTDEFQRWEQLYPRSWMEKRFGIKVINFYLQNVLPTAETSKAFEDILQAQKRSEAGKVRVDFIEATIARLVEKGVSPDRAASIAELAFGEIEGLNTQEHILTINSPSGSGAGSTGGGVMPVVVINPQSDSGKKGGR